MRGLTFSVRGNVRREDSFLGSCLIFHEWLAFDDQPRKSSSTDLRQHWCWNFRNCQKWERKENGCEGPVSLCWRDHCRRLIVWKPLACFKNEPPVHLKQMLLPKIKALEYLWTSLTPKRQNSPWKPMFPWSHFSVALSVCPELQDTHAITHFIADIPRGRKVSFLMIPAPATLPKYNKLSNH